MTESYAKRYLKRCEEFILCAELGGKDFIGIERSKFRYTLYQYFIHGSASFYEISDDGIGSRTIAKEKQLIKTLDDCISLILKKLNSNNYKNSLALI